MDREQFLRRVSAALLQTHLPPSPQVPADLPDFGDRDLLDLFRSRLQEVDAVFHGPVSRHGAPRAITSIAAGHDARTFMAWDDPGASGVVSALVGDGLERINENVPFVGRHDHLRHYRKVDVGITGADAGLAESGSVVLAFGPGRPRLAALVPEVHIVLLQEREIYRTLAGWASTYPDFARLSTSINIVSGPSRTGDIEQVLQLGVHGPKHLHVVIIK